MRYFAALALLACATPLRANDLEDGLRGLAAADTAATTAGFRLTSANADRCESQRQDIGVMLQDSWQYDARARATVREVMGLAGDLAFSVVVKGGPADLAGIPAGSELLAIDGVSIAELTGTDSVPDRGSYERLQQAEQALDTALEDGSAELSLRLPGGESVVRSISAVPVCSVRVRVKPSSGAQARADDTMIEVTTGLITKMESDGELAAIIAHELGHFVLQHYEENEADGRSRKILRRQEEEADRISVWLMLAAGYDPHQAVALWTHFAALQHSFLSFGYHGSRKDRRERLLEEIARAESGQMSTFRHN